MFEGTALSVRRYERIPDAQVSSGANLTGASDGATLNFVGTDLRKAILTDTNLAGADFTDADLTDANLKGANLSERNLQEQQPGQRRRLGDADLTNAMFEGTALSVRRYERIPDAQGLGLGANLTSTKATAREFLNFVGHRPAEGDPHRHEPRWR